MKVTATTGQVVSNLATGEPLWFGRERKKETLDQFFREQLSSFQRSAIRAACVDMWEPFRQSLEQWIPGCRIIYDKFHILQHAGAAVDEVRRAEFFRKGGAAREVVKGKRWLLLSRWVHLDTDKKRQLIRPEPPGDESLPAEREPGAAMELHL